MVFTNLFAGNGDAEVGNGLVSTMGEIESGAFGENNINIYILSCVK